MPELPEVEVVRAGLAPAATDARIESVTVFDERSLRRHEGPAEDFVERLEDRVMLTPERRGKFLWIPLAPAASPAAAPAPESREMVVPAAGTRPFDASEGDSEVLMVHLGMSGQVLLRDRATDDRLTRIRLDVSHPTHGPLRLNFVDQRIFGSMAVDRLVAPADGLGGHVPSQVSHIARDPLDEHFDERRFLTRLAARRTGIKRALLDQTLISGIGNIYADEALWAARIHYDEPTDALSRPRAKRLLQEVRHVLTKALAEGGTSFDTQYLNVNGESGFFAHSLNAYGQQGKPCPRCSRQIVREQFMNRGSHFCAHCQRRRAAG
ncbi:bifunctional DNA-formamidopyrimidine glycosylase/DNA-(apurinic or apyrimidinic site) lyase [Salinibacterium sp. SYSU T00001]|uniref:bifunctional DNA-formamidopyrimidine glycosylase/DNA-(apurinic or apyrimidinic site) lyase n=1 Tax=Homoserinimonas sedimenticola TaxID=2986805 RepID=UPI0022361895|nr:bifunctional DNA-formamidopyrimidine glycosylase/DNA-(apurinic or apyrimidinic site) lyase [Salinibacterium sedimenticola]MCW4384882.1 bifunctional DNA-formamidopyrimidine glycosylase/DNA-(apurinic or apyrimidinic site) lyase [Salinibacterium sedimenticola]